MYWYTLNNIGSRSNLQPRNPQIRLGLPSQLSVTHIIPYQLLIPLLVSIFHILLKNVLGKNQNMKDVAALISAASRPEQRAVRTARC